ncbi:MAG: potassium-transporting ATPase subunit KdpC [Phycisphaerales bacterium]
MFQMIRASCVMLILLTVITGVGYPAAVTAIAAMAFPQQRSGNLVVEGDRPVGSRLIGQPFDDPKYFWGRPSATSPAPYNAAGSSGSNLGPLNPALAEAVKARVEALRKYTPGDNRPVPVDLVTASASGLDPHISIAAAEYQVPRVALARGLSEEQVRALVAAHTLGRQFGVLGEPRVEVLPLNLALDNTKP